MERHILHIDQDSFFVEVARRHNPDLKGKPVIIGGMSGRAVVASCSYEARRYGVHSAMPMTLARQLCPDAIVVKCDFDLVSRHSQEITDIIADTVPLFEKTSIDEHYADLTGLDKHFGCVKFAHEMRLRIINETGLPVSFGLSINKTVSKIATGKAKPNGEWNVPTGDERSFLAPLSIRRIPGIGDTRYKTLRTLGVEHIYQIQKMSAELMQQVLKKDGVSIWQKANAIDDSPVIPYREQQSMGHEETFQQDTIDMELLRKTIITMITDLGFVLRTEGRMASTVVVKIRYSDFETHEKQTKISFTNLDSILTKVALETFQKLYTRRVLIRLIGVKVTGLIYGNPMIDLFDTTTEQIKLNAAMDSIKKRFGAHLVKVASIC